MQQMNNLWNVPLNPGYELLQMMAKNNPVGCLLLQGEGCACTGAFFQQI